ncbi:MAG: hypothetical protein GWO44_03445, partial [Thermoplasmata archaeon]|nr:hypothetical protein [Thermoplasmata archaeon]NIY02346.1 hypothetical protein [Thermoplasmata archaeon]
MRVIVDDVGSYPPMKDPRFESRLRERAGDATALVVELFEEKRSTGLDVPCYPQLTDMVE